VSASIVLALALWTSAPDAGVVGQAARAVSWSRSLAPAGVGAAMKALDAELEQTWDTHNFRTGETRQVRTCRQALALPDGFEPDGPESDYHLFVAMRVRCRVIAALPALTSATVDHLGAFPLDQARLRELPAALIPTPSRDEAAALEAASTGGATWTEKDRGARVGRSRRGMTVVESKARRCFLEVIARGDLDGDGVEDLLLWRSGGGRRGTWTTTDVFVLTRRARGGQIEIVRRYANRK
jgi:hypothetical protein